MKLFLTRLFTYSSSCDRSYKIKMMDLGSEIAALEDDMQEFNLEKTVKHSLKVGW